MRRSPLFPKLLMALIGTAALAVPAEVFAQATPSANLVAPAAEPDPSVLPLEETLKQPAVPKKQRPYITSYMHREAEGLDRLGFQVETMRQGEVVIATIPADQLFAPNDTTLLPSADKRLEAFLPYFRTAGMFRVVLAMHSDDTGSESYLQGLTESRIMALYDYFDDHGNDTESLIGYPMADSDPAATNSSRRGRAENRRLEIYIVPGPGLIAKAKEK